MRCAKMSQLFAPAKETPMAAHVLFARGMCSCPIMYVGVITPGKEREHEDDIRDT